MDRSAILKRTGLAFGSFIVITVIVFFLYPYLNEEKYGEIVESSSESEIVPKESIDDLRLGGEFEYLSEEINFYKKEQTRLLAIIDSLENRNEAIKKDYEQQIADLMEQNAEAETVLAQENPEQTPIQQQQQEPAGQAQFVADAGNMANPGNMGMEMTQQEQEEFFDRVKSFLNLDEEELAPIVSKLDNEELVRLYRGGGTIQREKLLRSLKPDRAAEIMKEIML